MCSAAFPLRPAELGPAYLSLPVPITLPPAQRINFFFFWPCHVACGILVSQPGIEIVPPALEAQSLNHWTTREVSQSIFTNESTEMSSTAPSTVLMPPSCSRIQGGTADPSIPLQVFSWLLGL